VQILCLTRFVYPFEILIDAAIKSRNFHPMIETGDLIDRLCDLGLESWSKTASPRDLSRQRSESRASVRRAVFAEEACVNCGSKYALEEDHIVPQAVGGDSSRENLRLLCRKCRPAGGD